MATEKSKCKLIKRPTENDIVKGDGSPSPAGMAVAVELQGRWEPRFVSFCLLLIGAHHRASKISGSLAWPEGEAAVQRRSTELCHGKTMGNNAESGQVRRLQVWELGGASGILHHHLEGAEGTKSWETLSGPDRWRKRWSGPFTDPHQAGCFLLDLMDICSVNVWGGGKKVNGVNWFVPRGASEAYWFNLSFQGTTQELIWQLGLIWGMAQDMKGYIGLFPFLGLIVFIWKVAGKAVWFNWFRQETIPWWVGGTDPFFLQNRPEN